LELKTFKIELESLSPILITVTEGYRGFLYRSLRYYIPGSVIQGSIMTTSISEGLLRVNEAYSIVNKELFNTTPALTTIDFNYKYIKDLGIAHALCLRPKVKSKKMKRKYVISIDVGKIIKELTLKQVNFSEMVKEVLDRSIIDIARELEVHPADLEDCSGFPIIKQEKTWILMEDEERIRILPKTHISIEVKDWGGTVPGALYAYEYIERGLKFKSHISCPKESTIYKILKQLESIGYVNARIGKATSRGLGMIRLKLIEYPIEDLIDQVGINEINVNDKIIALETLSITSVLDPLPRPLKTGDVVSDKLNLGLKMQVVGILESKHGAREYRGWSIATNTPKLTIKGLPQGSIIFTRITKTPPTTNQLHQALISLLLLGLGPISQGFNIVYPFKKDPYILEVK